MFRKTSATTWAVQSCITTVSFPATITDLEGMFRQNRFFGTNTTDMDTLLIHPPTDGIEWTAPRWMTQGDVLFFYHSLSARARIATLRKQMPSVTAPRARLPAVVQRLGGLFGIYGTADRSATLAEVLDRAANTADRFGGSIFACATVTGLAATHRKPVDEKSHVRSTVFAPLGPVHIFDHPLQANDYKQCVTIGQPTITPLAGKSFTCLREQFARYNRLPAFLEQAAPGGPSFGDVNARTWREIACASAARFIDEAQIRAYLLDYFLDELKDRRTAVLEECRCLRHGKHTGNADYMIRLFGRWVPVEAKLNILSERDLPAQLDKYIHITGFMPTRGTLRQTPQPTDDGDVCLVADQAGIYLTRERAFVGCGPGNPLITREALAAMPIETVRSRVQSLLASSNTG